MSTLHLDAVTARRGRRLSHPITLRVQPGEVLALVGPNGVGKSSLLAAIAHAGVDYDGRITIGDADVARSSARERARHIALLAQDTHGPHELLVRELVAIGARAGGHRDDLDDRIDEALARVDATAWLRHRLGALSGGARQLVHLARVLAQDTALVLLDEPTAALDIAHQVRLERVIGELAAEGRGVIVAVHDLSLALNAGTSVLMLVPGGEYVHGPPHEVLTAERVHHAYGVPASVHTLSTGRHVVSADHHHSEESP